MSRVFVVMPFGTKSASPEHGIKEINFDRVYQELIIPAAQSVGWESRRIDELSQPGSIEHQYLKEILEADLMVADVSVPNGNVYYELGLRQAISNAGTILIAHVGSRLPFDIASQRVLFYEPSEPGIRQAILRLSDAIRADGRATNPVREYLEVVGLSSNPARDSIRFQQDIAGRIERCDSIDQVVAVWHWARRFSPVPGSSLLMLAKKMGDLGEWKISTEVLQRAVIQAPEDFEVHRLLGWHLSKLGPKHDVDALASFAQALALNPDDPETLGMQGGLLKRQGRYQEANACYARGATLSPASLYMRVNAAAMAILIDPTKAEDGIVRYSVLLRDLDSDPILRSDPWAELTCGEAAFAIGDDAGARSHYGTALRAGISPSALRSAIDQLALFSSRGFRTEEATRLVQWLRSEIDIRTNSARSGSPTSVKMRATHARVIVHLSDVHFGFREKDGKRTPMHRFLDGEYNQTLSQHLAEELRGRRPAVICDPATIVLVISGDLTYGATREEFKLVQAFLEEVCGRLQLDKERVILVPGNHDVHWPSAASDRSTRFDHYVAFLVNFYGEALFRKMYPLSRWDLRVDGTRDAPHSLVGVARIDDILYVSMNSCVYETEQHHYGFVGGRQLKLMEDVVRDTKDDLIARVAVLHHHLHPFPETLDQDRGQQEIWMDLSTVRDAGLVERRLERMGFDLVLHGHKHKAQLRETLVRDQNERLTATQRLIVCGAGSTGVNGLELGAEPNHYEIIEVLSKRQPGVDFLRVHWRELALVPDSEWSTRNRWEIQG